jgi:hypothetical protein
LAVIINLKDGLGNQMFQYALGYVLSKENKTKLKLDLRVFKEKKINPPKDYVQRKYDLDIFGIVPKKPSYIDLIKTFQLNKRYVVRYNINKFLDKFNFINILERGRKYETRILKNKKKTLYIDGYWQCEKYFSKFRNNILKIFNFESLKKKPKNIKFICKINKEHSVCLNVRRTDHMIFDKKEFDVVDFAYYKKAINYFKSNLSPNVKFYIFSDDLEWCKKIFKNIENIEIVDYSYSGKKFYNYLYLMTNFRNFIIPNSTFGWWAAWLSTKKNKIVLAPKKWSGKLSMSQIDILPNKWIKISN